MDDSTRPPRKLAEEDNSELETKYAKHLVDGKIPKNLRIRYWTSCEESRLIELWHKYNNEITTLSKNTPVFRKISEGMREYGFKVNAQECRRKINSLKNIYIAHCSSTNQNYKAEKSNRCINRYRNKFDDDSTKWPYRDLIDVICNQNRKRSENVINDVNHQEMILKSLFDSMKKSDIKFEEDCDSDEPSTSTGVSKFKPRGRPSISDIGAYPKRSTFNETSNTGIDSEDEAKVKKCRISMDIQISNIFGTKIDLSSLQALQAENELLQEKLENFQKNCNNIEMQIEKFEELWLKL